MAATEGYATPETLKGFLRARDLLGDGGNLDGTDDGPLAARTSLAACEQNISQRAKWLNSSWH